MKQLVARTSEQLTACKDLILRLRPDLNENNYLNLLRNMMEEESFKLVYIPNDGGVNAAAFIGYRTMYLLQQGWVMYIDGQYTDPQYQGRGYTGSLLDFAAQEAREAGIQFIHLVKSY